MEVVLYYLSSGAGKVVAEFIRSFCLSNADLVSSPFGAAFKGLAQLKLGFDFACFPEVLLGNFISALSQESGSIRSKGCNAKG